MRVDRPNMPPSYGVVADAPDFVPLEWSWVTDQLAESRNYWIATVDQNGKPHVSPVWGVWLEEAMCFGTDAVSAKGRNIARDAEIAVHLESGDDVVIMYGIAEEIIDQATLAKFVSAYDEKYDIKLAPSDKGTALLAFRPSKVLGWRESDFPNTATRWRT
ncbi:MAG: pyridoxamine 5'-phosphate oxidase family protein [Chloroflexi bacterium]|nr:pyridoxamine 5'-phosphate oxidase family protein [Chloroflexota bacterium]